MLAVRIPVPNHIDHELVKPLAATDQLTTHELINELARRSYSTSSPEGPVVLEDESLIRRSRVELARPRSEAVGFCYGCTQLLGAVAGMDPYVEGFTFDSSPMLPKSLDTFSLSKVLLCTAIEILKVD
jgi:hypothetical protein